MLEETWLSREIHEQPDALGRLLAAEGGNIERISAELARRHITNVFIAARGTSDNAGRYAQYLLGAANQLPVGLGTPSLFSIYHTPPRFQDALIIGISQSGASPDMVSVVAEARAQGAATLGITNVPDSALGKTAEYVIPLHAGDEKSLAATKTFTTELMALALLSASLPQAGGRMHGAAMLDTLQQIPELARRVLDIEPDVAHRAERYRYMRVCVVIGRGYNYATAFEVALKIKELTYVLAEPYSSADFYHGPLALVEDAFPTIVIAPGGAMQDEMMGFIRTLRQRGAEVIAISDVPAILDLARVAIQLPVTVPEWASPLVSVLPGQLFAMHLANTRDYDVDHPRGLRKVTETV